jgi:hypothetical protein
MELIGKNKEFTVVFNPDTQMYTVYKSGKMLISNKYRYRDIKSYLD